MTYDPLPPGQISGELFLALWAVILAVSAIVGVGILAWVDRGCGE